MLTLLGTFPTGGIGAGPSFAFGNNASDRNLILDLTGTTIYAVNGGSDSVAAFRVHRDGSLIDHPRLPRLHVRDRSDERRRHGIDPVGGQYGPGSEPTGADPARLHVVVAGTVRRISLWDPRSVIATDIGSYAFGDPVLTRREGRLRQQFRGRHYPVVCRLGEGPADPDRRPGSARRAVRAKRRRARPAGVGGPPQPLRALCRLPIHQSVGRLQLRQPGPPDLRRLGRQLGAANCWLVTNSSGDRLYTANTGDRSVSVFDISNAKRPAQIQNVVLQGSGGLFQIDINGPSTYFYALTQRNDADVPFTANALHVLRVNGDGKLTEVPSSPTVLPVPQDGTRPLGVLAP